MQKTVVLNVVGLTSELIGGNMPFLNTWAQQGKRALIHPVLPAVTCPAQATYFTGKWPDEHGIVANGWYFRDVCEVRNWHQSAGLVEAPKIWEVARELDPDFTCANIGWWFNMYSGADYSVTPRPQYREDGRKVPDCYTNPPGLRDDLQEMFGQFPLFHYWGPTASIRSNEWLAKASLEVDRRYDPTLTLIYLPYLDYNLQRLGPDDPAIAGDLQKIDRICRELIEYYEAKDARVIVLSEYGITAVDRPVALNRALRSQGYLAIREEQGTELLDAGASEAFAVAEHQVAHVYVKRPENIGKVKELLEAVPGVEKVLAGAERDAYHIAHSRAGELIAVADPRSWFTYYYWLDDRKAPDFARLVAIHKKPGYDPAELFVDPEIRFPKLKVGWKLLKKKLGFRMLMDVIALDGSQVKGSHGRIPESRQDYPVLLTRDSSLLPGDEIRATEVFDVILGHLKSRPQSSAT